MYQAFLNDHCMLILTNEQPEREISHFPIMYRSLPITQEPQYIWARSMLVHVGFENWRQGHRTKSSSPFRCKPYMDFVNSLPLGYDYAYFKHIGPVGENDC